ncbi:hypothetical protein ACMFLR_23530 [Delftia tsuruhatensis]|uniref:hypothetical protein n=1 Tax=Delftia tsuruhatensis TaxID=180282 RepID=UPI0039BC7A25
MKSIGIRATPSSIHFSIYCNKAKVVINTEEVKIPLALTTPLGLKYIRSTILDILREYEIENACIRATEPSAQKPSIERLQIEAVIQEAFASSDLCRYYVGHISSISKNLGIQRTKFKPMVDGESNDLNIQNWDILKKEQREAVLAAIGAIETQGGK